MSDPSDNAAEPPRTRPSSWKKVVGISIVVILALALFAFSLCVVHFVTLRNKIHRYQSGYDRVERGITAEELASIMGEPTSIRSDWPVKFWDWDPLPQAEIDRIVKTYKYGVDTFFLPITFAFSLDAEDKVIAKHSYD